MFETFSFLPPLTDGEIIKQVDYIVNNAWSELATPAASSAARGARRLLLPARSTHLARPLRHCRKVAL